MSVLVVGSVAFDTIETPHGKVEDALGGSATYISLCASLFDTEVRLVATVGNDFPERYVEYFRSNNIDVQGLQFDKEEKTFRWGGRYDKDLADRETLFTELNVFAKFKPEIPHEYKKSRYICLGNIDPLLQQRVLEQVEKPDLVIGDTMNFWIEGKRNELEETIRMLDIFIINDSEAYLLTGEDNPVKGGEKILEMGPGYVIIKKGKEGASLIGKNLIYNVPAYDKAEVSDPTGAGDAFAGGFIGWISQTGDKSRDNLKKAVLYGNATASFCIERFGIDRLQEVKEKDIRERVEIINGLVSV